MVRVPLSRTVPARWQEIVGGIADTVRRCSFSGITAGFEGMDDYLVRLLVTINRSPSPPERSEAEVRFDPDKYQIYCARQGMPGEHFWYCVDNCGNVQLCRNYRNAPRQIVGTQKVCETILEPFLSTIVLAVR